MRWGNSRKWYINTLESFLMKQVEKELIKGFLCLLQKFLCATSGTPETSFDIIFVCLLVCFLPEEFLVQQNLSAAIFKP